MTSEELNSTKQSKWISFNYKEFYDRVKFRPEIKYKDLSGIEKYISDCFDFHSRILSTCLQLEQVTIYVRRFDKKYFNENDIGQSDFIQYHLEVYIGKLFTLMELLLQYTNIIYELGLKPKQCNLENIRKKLNKELPTLKILDEFAENLKNWRLIGNRTVHQNEFSKDEDFKRLSAEESIWLISERINHKPEIDWVVVKPRHFVDWFLKQERKKKIELIRKNNIGTNQFIANYDICTINEIKNKMAMHNSTL